MTLDRTIHELQMISELPIETVQIWWNCETKKEAIQELLDRKDTDLFDSTILEMAGINLNEI